MGINIFSTIALMLEKLKLRCTKCRAWRTSMITTEEKLEWASNCGGILFTDPFYMKITTCHCSTCGHVMSEKTHRSEHAVE